MSKHGITKYEIKLAKQSFLPGEDVHGTVFLSTNKPISCRGVRVRLSAVSRSFFITVFGDDEDVSPMTYFLSYPV